MTLKEVLEKAKSSYSKAPDGKLKITNCNGYTQYYSGTEYLSKKNITLVKQLAQKEYDKQVIKCAEQQIKITETYKAKHDAQAIENIFLRMPYEMQRLITPYVIPKDEYIKQWSMKSFKTKDEEGTFLTTRGELVRSKSEVIIADRLYAAGIPYRYEAQLRLVKNNSHVFFYPDFTVLNPKTLDEYIFEHFGMMDKSEYALNAISKINTYSFNGYVQGKNILFSFETTNNPLNPSYVDKLIEEFLKK